MRKILTLLSALALAGCFQSGAEGWRMANGGAVSATQIEIDQTVCRGEVQKSARASSAGTLSVEASLAERDIFAGCMAQKGYLQR